MRSELTSEHWFFRVLDRIVWISKQVSLLSIWVMALLLFYDVFLRNVLNMTSDWSLDVVQLIQVLLAFSAAAPVLKDGGHINMEALSKIVSSSSRRVLDMISNMICTLGCLWMVALSWRTFARSHQIREAAYGIDIPLYPWKFLVPLCFFVLALQFFRMFVNTLRNK